MKNFFEFFGFLSTACISAALIFIFIGNKKDALRSGTRSSDLTEMGAEADIPNAPRAIADRPMRSSNANIKREKSLRPEAAAAPELAPEERLKSLYNDQSFIAATAKEWKALVRDAADEYNVKPQVLLAHVLVQSYLNEYTRNQLYNDAARHAGERVKPLSAAIKGYRYSWSMQKLMQEHDLLRYFPEESTTAMASVNTSRKVVEKGAVAKGIVNTSAPLSKTNPMEEGFKNMVAKEYGFASWAGLNKLADPDTKAEATRRVKSLMMASRVR